jgi:Methane oxygenase PmoA
MTNSMAARALLAFVSWTVLVSGQTRSGVELRLQQDSQTGAIRVYRDGVKDPILTQNASADNRPYLHPIVAPDGKGVLTEYRPAHHPHQTGIFWGFKYVGSSGESVGNWWVQR